MKVVRAIGQAFEVCHKINVSNNGNSSSNCRSDPAASESADLVVGNDNTNNNSGSITAASAETAAATGAEVTASCTGNKKKKSSSPSVSSSPLTSTTAEGASGVAASAGDGERFCCRHDERRTEHKAHAAAATTTVTKEKSAAVKRDEDLLMKASSTPAIISTAKSSNFCNRARAAPDGSENSSILSTFHGKEEDASKFTDQTSKSAIPEMMTSITSGGCCSHAADKCAADGCLPHPHPDLSCMSRSLQMMQERMEQLCSHMSRMEENQSKLLQILLMDKKDPCDRMNHASHLSSKSATMAGFVPSSSSSTTITASGDHPVMIQKSLLSGLPSSASLPLDCLSFNSIQLFQQQASTGNQAHSVSALTNGTSGSSQSSGCPFPQSSDHHVQQQQQQTYQPHFQSILNTMTGYQMSTSTSSKPPDSLPLQSPGHDSLISSGQ